MNQKSAAAGPKIEKLTSRLVPLPSTDVDTDQITPARFLKVTNKEGLRDVLFADWRQEPSFILNQPEVAGAEILLAGDNFGCGSSREHAPWALVAWGFRAVISTSFADIFRNNSLKNGLLPVAVPEAVQQALFAAREKDPAVQVTIDLESQTLTTPSGDAVTFPIDPFAKHRLLEGIDELGYLMSFEEKIARYEETEHEQAAR